MFAPLAPVPEPHAALRIGRRPFNLLGFWVLYSLGSMLGLAAAEANGRIFSLPADFIEPSLKRFSTQSGLQVLFPTDAVAAVRTQPVQGTFSALQALERMLAGTGFSVFQDPKSGALTVRRNPVSRAEAPIHRSDFQSSVLPQTEAISNQSAKSDHKSMKPRTKIAALVGSLLALTFAPGQAADTTESTPRPKKDEADVVALSPFTVNSDRDVGYQALSTLAGTRLDSPLRDLGAAISIYTKDFLNDINATSSSDFLLYATGMDVSGPGGNFGGASNDINAIAVEGSAYRRNPQNEGGRSRGLASPTFTRDFFATSIATDSYNSDRVTILRGPNAALFGVGSPAGVVDSSTIRADLRKEINNISFRYGNNDSTRTTVDFNRVLIKDKLAVRIAGLKADEQYNQRPAFEKKDRIFGTLTYKPYESTSLRVNFESGVQKANRPFPVITALNSIMKDWYDAGRPGFDWSFYDDPVRNPLAASQNSSNELNNIPYLRQAQLQPISIFYNSPNQQRPSFAISPAPSNTGNATVANAILTSLFHPQLNRDLAPDTPSFSQTRNIQEVSNNYWTGARVYPGQLPGFVPAGLKFQSFTDFSAFDWANQMIDDSSRQYDNFHSFNVTLEQRAWKNRVGFELSLNQQRKDTRTRSLYFGGGTGTAHIRIDTSVTGPTGLPNPNLGRPYVTMTFGGSYYNLTSNLQTVRANGYLKYDFKDLGKSWGKWLGSHTLSGVAERFENTDLNYQTRFAYDGELADRISPNITGRTLTTVVYMGPSLIGNTNPLKLEPIRVPALNIGPAGNVSSFTRTGTATDPGAFADSPLDVNWTNVNGQVGRAVIESTAVTLQSNWLQHHIVTVFGLRRDTSYNATQSTATVYNPADPQNFGKIFWGVEDVNALFPHTPPRNVSRESKSASIVGYWPQKLIKLPKGTDLSVFYNQSENFTPVGGRITYWNTPIAAPRGSTKERGLSFSAFNDKLTVRLSQFETKSTGLSGQGLLGGAMGTYFPALAFRWLTEGNVNPHLQAMRNADIAAINDALKALPTSPDILSLWAVSVSGTAPNLVATRASNLPGANDTTDFVAKGEEADLIFNPTKNWRVLVNVAHQETKKSNIAPNAQLIYATILPVLERLKDRALGTYPEGWQIGDPLPANRTTLGQDVDANLKVPYATDRATEGDPNAEQRNWRVNLVANYKFTATSPFGETLKGWSVGGGVRWQSKMIVGLPSTRSPNGAISFDRRNPFYAPSETNVDAFIGYERRIWSNRIGWKVQLNVANIYQERDLITVAIQPWGEVSAARPAPERRWYLTNTFSF